MSFQGEVIMSIQRPSADLDIRVLVYSLLSACGIVRGCHAYLPSPDWWLHRPFWPFHLFEQSEARESR